MVFITSRRTWATASRVCIVILLVVLAVWAFVHLRQTPQVATAQPAAAPQPLAVTPAPVKPADVAPAAVQAPVGVAMPAPPTGQQNAVVLPPMAAAPPVKPVAAPATPVPAAPSAPAPAMAMPPKLAPAPIANADRLLAEAQAKLDAGDLLAVRTLLNDGIVSDAFQGPAADKARLIQGTANAKLIFSRQPFAGDSYVDVVKVDSGNSLRKIAATRGVPWELICRANDNLSDRKIRVGMQLKAPIGPFNVVVTKSAYRLDLYLGGLPGEPGALYVTSLPVGLGRDNSTPTGLWSVTRGGKMKNPAWTNPRTSEHYEGYDPKNPLGGYWIALTGEAGSAVGQQSYGIHGTIEPESVGKQASMGCVRLKVEDIAFVYDCLTDGKSRVIIRD